jgi:2-hydroxy-6-oxonona-2,4-dienedioate hydrolase
MEQLTAPLANMWTSVDGYRVYSRVSAAPPVDGSVPVVLVHGLAVSSLYMVPTAEHLAPYYRVYAPDFPGFGKSEKPKHVLTIAELADVLAAYMRTVGVERAAMVANSLGCQIVVDFALRYPEMIDRAVLIGPTMDRHAPNIPQQFWRLVRDTFREPPSQPFVIFFDYLKAGLRRTISTARYGLQDRIEEKLPNVGIPMMIVRGERDPIVSQPWAEEFASLLPLGRQVVIPGTAHTVNYSAPAALVREIRPFFGRQTPASNG